MKFLELQIVAMTLGLVSIILLVYKKKLGWLLSIVAGILYMFLNYLAELYFLIVPGLASWAVSIWGWFKWRRDEKRSVSEVRIDELEEEKKKLSDQVRVKQTLIDAGQREIRYLKRRIRGEYR